MVHPSRSPPAQPGRSAVDKLVPDDGDTVEETGHGKVLLTSRFTHGELVGRVQIKFAGFNPALHYGGGCRASNYKAPIKIAE